MEIKKKAQESIYKKTPKNAFNLIKINSPKFKGRNRYFLESLSKQSS